MPVLSEVEGAVARGEGGRGLEDIDDELSLVVFPPAF